jgi:O-antigen/teichoic acid export membrane protein
LGSAVLGRQILTILYRPQYAEHVDLLLWLMAVGAVGCVASCLGCAMSAAGQFRQQVPLFIVVTGSSFVACYFLIPWRGLQGAALAALVSMCVQLIGTIFIVYRALQKRARALRPPVAISIEPALESQ